MSRRIAVLIIATLFLATSIVAVNLVASNGDVEQSSDGGLADSTDTADFSLGNDYDAEAAKLTCGGGTAISTNNGKTLTITGINFVTSAKTAITTDQDLEIIVHGTNTVKIACSDRGALSVINMTDNTVTLKIDGDGVLNVLAEGSKESSITGIHCSHKPEYDSTTEVSGGVTLNIRVGAAANSLGISTNILKIRGENTNVSAIVSDDVAPELGTISIGIAISNELNMTEGSLEAKGGNITNCPGGKNQSYGLYMGVASDPLLSITGGNAKFSGGDVIGKGLLMESHGISIQGGRDNAVATISGSIVSATAGKVSSSGSEPLSVGIFSKNIDLMISDSVFGNVSGYDCAVNENVKFGDRQLALIKGSRSLDDIEYEAVDDSNVYAMKVLRTLYDVTYDTDGGSGDAPTQESLGIGDSFIVAGYDGSKDGYTFKGWSDGTNTYQPGETYVMGYEDVKLTAVWEKNADGIVLLAVGSVAIIAALALVYYFNFYRKGREISSLWKK